MTRTARGFISGSRGAPTSRWPLDSWLRRLAIASGLLAGVSLRVSFTAFVVVLLLLGTMGYNNARRSAFHRRQFPDRQADAWRAQRRWQARSLAAVSFTILSFLTGIEFACVAAMCWSLGWRAGEFVDRRTPDGQREWDTWERSESALNEKLWQLYDEEWLWAMPFPSFHAYIKARAGRPGSPLTEIDFVKARAGVPPPRRGG